jgi:ferredoxin
MEMPQATLVEPDLQFIKQVKAYGGDTLKKCFQCATCSVVCNLSPEERPFPRKEMIWTQWGLKDRLAQDPDIWLCHHCNDCSKYCPRGAKPGDVLSALRHMAILNHAFPRFVAQMVGDPRFLPVVFAIPVILLLLLMFVAGTLNIPEGEILYRKFIPQWPVIDVLFPLTALWAVICSAMAQSAEFLFVMPSLLEIQATWVSTGITSFDAGIFFQTPRSMPSFLRTIHRRYMFKRLHELPVLGLGKKKRKADETFSGMFPAIASMRLQNPVRASLMVACVLRNPS